MIRREMTAQYSGNYRDFRVLRCLTVIDIFQKCELPVIFPPKEKRTKIKS